ncbi:DUF2164 domain-containing protein [Roseibium sp. CAU 1637]|uniref:DUF2164 domain-containing protein n=1 Tax=Roseibium limicola TaxID=2816037 RepID=A0A939EM27_9HYPH|nr:DUF2164 domain-containing protein [Roseibium limicola]MBO0344938.1 DUF2164 domain-containing protein [Roseibium limicola]
MPDDILTRETRDALVRTIQAYCQDELDMEMGNMDAGFLLDHLSETMGAAYYNKGLQDAGLLFAKKAEDIADELYGLEKPWSGRS